MVHNRHAAAIRILHVEDEKSALEITTLFLKRGGYNTFEIRQALSAEQALAMLDNELFDVVLSDYKMPGMNGLEFLEELRKRGNDIPFIIFTGKGEERVAIEALNKGANRFIKKEGSPNALFDTLGRYIQEVVEERHKDPNISKFIAKLIEQDDKIKDLKRSNRKLNRLLENLEPMPQPKESRVDIATIVNEHLRLIILGILVDQPAGEDDYKSLSERELIKEIHHKFDLWVKPEMLRTSLNALKEKGIILDAAGRIAITPFHLR